MRRGAGDALEEFVARGQRAQHVADHLCAYGPGLTFGELAIGELFHEPVPLPGYRGLSNIKYPEKYWPGINVKVSATTYELLRDGRVTGTGTAEDYYRVERVTEVGRSAGDAVGTSASDPDVEGARRPADTNTHITRRQS